MHFISRRFISLVQSTSLQLSTLIFNDRPFSTLMPTTNHPHYPCYILARQRLPVYIKGARSRNFRQFQLWSNGDRINWNNKITAQNYRRTQTKHSGLFCRCQLCLFILLLWYMQGVVQWLKIHSEVPDILTITQIMQIVFLGFLFHKAWWWILPLTNFTWRIVYLASKYWFLGCC